MFTKDSRYLTILRQRRLCCTKISVSVHQYLCASIWRFLVGMFLTNMTNKVDRQELFLLVYICIIHFNPHYVSSRGHYSVLLAQKKLFLYVLCIIERSIGEEKRDSYDGTRGKLQKREYFPLPPQYYNRRTEKLGYFLIAPTEGYRAWKKLSQEGLRKT